MSNQIIEIKTFNSSSIRVYFFKIYQNGEVIGDFNHGSNRIHWDYHWANEDFEYLRGRVTSLWSREILSDFTNKITAKYSVIGEQNAYQLYHCDELHEIEKLISQANIVIRPRIEQYEKFIAAKNRDDWEIMEFLRKLK